MTLQLIEKRKGNPFPEYSIKPPQTILFISEFVRTEGLGFFIIIIVVSFWLCFSALLSIFIQCLDLLVQLYQL